jgi:hypothetical protein
MTSQRALVANGGVFSDTRTGDRALRVSTHRDHGVVVLSMWRGTICTASFRLDQADVPALVDALVRGLAPGALTTSA